MVSFKLCEEIENIRVWNPKVWCSIPHGDSEFFLCPMLVARWKNIFLLYLMYFTCRFHYWDHSKTLLAGMDRLQLLQKVWLCWIVYFAPVMLSECTCIQVSNLERLEKCSLSILWLIVLSLIFSLFVNQW